MHKSIVKIINVKGLHARPSAKFVKKAETFDCKVTVTKDDQSVGGTSIMGLMMLAAGPGTQLEISAVGADAEAAVAALSELIENGFDEDCV